MKKIKYIVAKTKLDAQAKEAVNDMETAKTTATQEELQNKLYLFAKKYNEKTKKNDYIVISYYDLVSPIGEITDKMQWFDAIDYLKKADTNDTKEKVRAKFKSLKV